VFGGTNGNNGAQELGYNGSRSRSQSKGSLISDLSESEKFQDTIVNEEHLAKAKRIAIDIYDEYLRSDAPNKVLLNNTAKEDILNKFGVYFPPRSRENSQLRININRLSKSTSSSVSEVINEEILEDNLNEFLFFEIFTQTMSHL